MKIYRTYQERKFNFAKAYNTKKDKTIQGWAKPMNCENKNFNKGLFMIKIKRQWYEPEKFDILHLYYFPKGENKAKYQIIIA